METTNRAIRLFADGGSRGNPGPAAIAFRVEDWDGKVLAECAALIEEDTSNAAEYKALIRGLEECLRIEAAHVICVSDSKLVVSQLDGTYQVKHPKLKQLHAEVTSTADRFQKVEYEHRSQGDDPGIAAVDAAVTMLLDKAVGRKRRSKASGAKGSAKPDAVG